MTVSTSTTFNLTSDQLVNAALRKLSVLGDGQAPSSSQLSNGTQALNAMLKTFTTKGMPLWVISEYNLTLTSASTYTFGVGQTVNTPAPLKVTQAVLVDNTNGSTIPMNSKTHVDFNYLPTATTGTPAHTSN